MQVYWVNIAPTATATPEPGQFVHYGNEDDFVRGFVAEVKDRRLLVYLFRPTEAMDFADIVHEELPLSVVNQRLFEILEANPAMRAMWFTAGLSRYDRTEFGKN